MTQQTSKFTQSPAKPSTTNVNPQHPWWTNSATRPTLICTIAPRHPNTFSKTISTGHQLATKAPFSAAARRNSWCNGNWTTYCTIKLKPLWSLQMEAVIINWLLTQLRAIATWWNWNSVWCRTRSSADRRWWSCNTIASIITARLRSRTTLTTIIRTAPLPPRQHQPLSCRLKGQRPKVLSILGKTRV